MRQVGFVCQRNRRFESDVGVGFHISLGGEQDTSCGYIQRVCRFHKLLPIGFRAAHEEWNRDWQTIPVTAFRSRCWGRRVRRNLHFSPPIVWSLLLVANRSEEHTSELQSLRH